CAMSQIPRIWHMGSDNDAVICYPSCNRPSQATCGDLRIRTLLRCRRIGLHPRCESLVGFFGHNLEPASKRFLVLLGLEGRPLLKADLNIAHRSTCARSGVRVLSVSLAFSLLSTR